MTEYKWNGKEAEYARGRYAANPEKYRERQRARYEANRERILARGRASRSRRSEAKHRVASLPGVPIPGLPDDKIRIQRDAQVWRYNSNWKQWVQVKAWRRGSRYLKIRVHLNGKTRTFGLASLICRAFHGPRPLGNLPYHYPDPDPLNCHADNLRWAPRGTRDLGNRPVYVPAPRKGEEHPNARLTNEEVSRLRELRGQGWTIEDLAEEFGISEAGAGLIASGKSWSHLPNTVTSVDTRARGTFIASAKLDDEQVRDIRRLHREGASRAAIAPQFNVSPSTVDRIIRRESWKHVPDLEGEATS